MTASEWVTMAGLLTNMVGSFYGVSPTAEATFASAAQRIYSRTSTSCDGCWTVAVLDPEDEQRLALREELGWLGLGALTPNVLSSPTVGTRPVAELVERLGSTLLALTRGPLEHGATLGDNALAVLVTPLHELHAAYLEHLDRFVPVLESIETEPDPADAFIVRTLLIDSWRRIVLRDVDLPEALLPPDWLGGRASEPGSTEGLGWWVWARPPKRPPELGCS